MWTTWHCSTLRCNNFYNIDIYVVCGVYLTKMEHPHDRGGPDLVNQHNQATPEYYVCVYVRFCSSICKTSHRNRPLFMLLVTALFLQPKSRGLGAFGGSQVARCRRRQGRSTGRVLQDRPRQWGMQSLWSLKIFVDSFLISSQLFFIISINSVTMKFLQIMEGGCFCLLVWTDWCYSSPLLMKYDSYHIQVMTINPSRSISPTTASKETL